MDYAAIKKAAEAYGPAMTKFLRDMIAIPSESCEEKGVVYRIKEEMEKLAQAQKAAEEISRANGQEEKLKKKGWKMA